MDRKSFKAPVTVYLKDSREFRVICDLANASDFLFDHWAGNDSPDWTFAMNKCSAAMMGKAPADEARTAFIAATKAAGMQINCEISLP
ncbi:DUF982 domain-containing protein [Mesorhizobium koreense]|jgi:hypothetical protein|uniref:DUF982 domain-containing protein n=1 Tax=Mesorhizobium koreense TaxID=3074855 RepID=UPI00287BA1DB|nr:DUF982 domain-containing protein [Mesorhizobium sp. WR6]